MSATDSMDSHQAENSQNYITVIPVEYPRSRVYPQAPEYLVDQYSEYRHDHTREEYIRGDYNINSEPPFDEVGSLYAVSQRFERDKPHLGTTSVGYDAMGHDVDRDWDRSLPSHTSGSSDTTQQSKDESIPDDLQSDNQQRAQLMVSKPLKMCVYLMSRVVLHMDVEDGVNVTVQELVQSVLQVEELGLPRVATNIFTLWMCSGLLGNILDSPAT